MSRVTLKGLTKTFGETVAVKDMDLEVEDKSFVALLGPSGCGKTTTLRCIAGLETPDKGEIYIGDRFVNDLAPKDRNIAIVFQSYALCPHMNVYDNIAFPLKMHKVPKAEIKVCPTFNELSEGSARIFRPELSLYNLFISFYPFLF